MKSFFWNVTKVLVVCIAHAFLLASCSTSIDDSSSSTNATAKGLKIAITTDSRQNTSRAATPDPYIAIVSITSNSYEDSQSKVIAEGNQATFTFENIPVGIEISVTCQIKLGTTVVFKDSQTAIVEPEGTLIELNLKNQLENTFVFEDTNLANLVALITRCKVQEGTVPTIVFKNSLTCLRDVIPYLQTNKPCNLNFSNIGRTTFTQDDFIDLDYDAPSGIRTFTLPDNSSVTITQPNDVEDQNLPLFNGSTISGAFVFLSGAQNPTIEFNYTGANPALFRNLDAATCNSCKTTNNYTGSIKLSNNLIIEASSATTMQDFLPMLSSSQATIRVKYNPTYESIMDTISLAQGTNITLQLQIDDTLAVSTMSKNTAIPNIKMLEFFGTTSSLSINSLAFERLTGLGNERIDIPPYIKVIERNPFGVDRNVPLRVAGGDPFIKYDADMGEHGPVTDIISSSHYGSYHLMR